MRVVVISDTHNKLADLNVPDGDLLIHCGDFCRRGTLEEVKQFNDDMSKLQHKHKVVIAGNHDWPFELYKEQAQACLTNMIYLEDAGVEIDGLKIYGSPWQPAFGNWAFNLPRKSEQIEDKWNLIPDKLDILITHGPPYGILDRTVIGKKVGCEILRDRVAELKPKVHCFGHIHEDYGQETHGETLYINASNLDVFYRPSHEPVVLTL